MTGFTGHETATAHSPSMCIYHATEVVRVEHQDNGIKLITLNTGGYYTATTKRRMNQFAEEYGYGFHVFQEKGDWFVTIRPGDTRQFPSTLDRVTFTHA